MALLEIIDLSKSFDGAQVLDSISLAIKHSEFLTLLGPSGCGKTTLLNIIAGFEQANSGKLIMNGSDISTDSPQQRNIHTIFQNYALFPHLSVFENVAFSLRCKKIDQHEIEAQVKQALELVKLNHLSQRLPTQLSGGQQQRVAIARGIIGKPQILLLDEPLSSLDYRLRKSMQYELKKLQRKLGMTFIFVTHDQEEALSLSDRIAVFNQGKIEQLGTPREIYETPVNLTVANFIGETNCFDCIACESDGKTIETKIENIDLTIENSLNLQTMEKFHLIIRPEDIRVWATHEVETTENMIPGHINDILYKGSTVDLKVSLASGKQINATEFFDEDDEDLMYEVGQAVWIHWLPGWEVMLPYEKN